MRLYRRLLRLKLIPFFFLSLALLPTALLSAPLPRALVVLGVGQTGPGKAERGIMAALRRAGYTPAGVPGDALAGPASLEAPDIGLVVLTRADRLPAAAAPPLDRYLKRGGRVIVLRAPAWQTPLIRWQGRWLTEREYYRATAAVPPDHPLFDFAPGGLAGWTRTSNAMESPTQAETVPADRPGFTRALRVKIANLTSWDTFVSPPLEAPFPDGNTITCFAAKGGPRTRQLAVEWDERDGSRWIAVVPLTEEWRRYALPPSAFRYWQSNPARAGDRFRPENAERVSFGLAFTHTIPVGGAHEYWVANVGTSRATGEEEKDPAAVAMPPMDGLYPAYKFFRVTGPVTLSVAEEARSMVGMSPPPTAATILAPHPRPRGVGLDRGRDWRWIPLITAHAPNGDWRGDPAAMLLWTGGPYKGAMVATFGVQDEGFYARPAVAGLIGRIAAAMRRGLFLQEAGADAFTYFADETPILGARAVNFGEKTACAVRLRVADRSGGKTLLTTTWAEPLASGDSVERRLNLSGQGRWPSDSLTVTAELVSKGRVVDRLTHDIHVWRPLKHPAFLRTGRGEFLLNGKPWRANGVNYMPSSGIGVEDGDFFERWIGKRSYDPEIIERDLRRVRAMGLNALSAFIYYQSIPGHNLLDFLRLCRKYGIRVNLSLRPGTPMDFRKEEILAIIRAFRLWKNDTVFAYDLAWEPSLGGHDARRQWDREWERWIIDRYGSVENAEKDWGFRAPRAGSPAPDDGGIAPSPPITGESDSPRIGGRGAITNPTGQQLTSDGPWRVMVAAYRHFCDDLLYRKYSAAADIVRSVDPNHLISFRMSEAGNPTYNWDAFLPYDFPALAGAVDFLAPEAYGRIGDWERVKPGVFEVAYARSCAPAKPVLWAEMGMSTMDATRYVNDPALLRKQADFYRAFYRLLRLSHSNGIFFWWYPGGFRVGENSDFGIINPDGTDRPVTKVIRQEAAGFRNLPPVPKPDAWITIDRDASPTGLYAVYEKAQAAFWRAVAAGKRLGLRTAAAGLDSRTVPLTAIGNVPFTGQNPPKFLDAAFDRLTAETGGRRQAVADGGTVAAPAGRAVRLTVVLRNLSAVTWRGRPGDFRTKGLVRLEAKHGASVVAAPIITDIPPLEQTAVLVTLLAPAAGQSDEVILRPAAQGRAAFGDAFRFRLEGR
jgi:hypothetical protein